MSSSATAPYNQINSMTEVQLIGGTQWTFEFTVYGNDMQPVDLGSKTCKWTLCPYGMPESPVLTKTATITATPGLFTVTITLNDTIDLAGVFIQQPIIIEGSGDEFRPAQGIVTIFPRIDNP